MKADTDTSMLAARAISAARCVTSINHHVSRGAPREAQFQADFSYLRSLGVAKDIRAKVDSCDRKSYDSDDPTWWVVLKGMDRCAEISLKASDTLRASFADPSTPSDDVRRVASEAAREGRKAIENATAWAEGRVAFEYLP